MRVLRFDVFTLDLSRCILVRDGQELPLRPKAFDVLRYLVEHPGRVISKDELFEAVWSGAARTDDALLKCIKDIRLALDDAGRRIIKTIPKRGYLFAAEVSETDAAAARMNAKESGAPVSVALSGTQLVEAILRRRLLRAEWRLVSPFAVAAILLAGAAASAALWPRPVARHEATPALVPLKSPQSAAAELASLGIARLNNIAPNIKANLEALTLFEQALTFDSNCVPALLGVARVKTGHVLQGWVPSEEHSRWLDQAEAAVDRALELEPVNATAHRYRGTLLRARRDWERAIATLEYALTLNPSSAWAHAELGRLKIEVGRGEEAITDIETATRLSPNATGLFIWYYWAGMAALHAGKNEAALQWLLKWRQADRTYDRFVIPWLAVAYAEVGQEHQGRALMDAYLAKWPISIASLQQDWVSRNTVVLDQRKRIAKVLFRLGVPADKVQTGLPRQ